MTALTPKTIRLDLKCGKGSISKGEKCRKGPATQVRELAEKVAPAALGLGVAAGLIALRRRGRANAQRPREVPKVSSDPPATPRSAISRSMQGRGERLANAMMENNRKRLREDPEGVRRQMRTSSPRAAYAGLMEELSKFNRSRSRRYTQSSRRRSAPTLEQWGQAAQQGPEALGRMMSSSTSNRRTRIKRRERSGLLQPPRRDVYAPGFTVDYDQLAV